MTKKILRLGSAWIVAAVYLAGCSTTNMHRERPFIESTAVHNRPISEPVRSVSSFSDGLICMDNLLRLEHLPPTLIASKQIIDGSGGKAAVSAKDMVITALSQMSRTSNTFHVVDFEVDPLRQDTVQTLTSVMLPSGQMQIPLPQLYVSGSISYVDQNVLIRNTGMGISHAKWEIGASNDIITTAIGMELHIGDFVTRTLFPGIDSANELIAGNKGAGLDLGARIKKAGVQFSFGGTTSQGVGPSVRTLVDLGMIELIGKWARVPYWQCLALDQSHPEFQRQLLDWFSSMSERDRTIFFQTGLRSLGYYAGEADGVSSPELKDALLLFQVDSQATPSGNGNFESYDRLMKHYVAVDSNGNFKRIGWTDRTYNYNTTTYPPEETPQSAPTMSARFTEKPRGDMPPFFSGIPLPIKVNITLDRRVPEYSLGEALLLNVDVDRMSYVSCFYQDASTTISQIYPSQFQPEIQLPAYRSFMIPNIHDPNSFSIEMTGVGEEHVLCVASSESLTQRIADELGASALSPIPDIENMEQLEARLKEIFGDEIKGANITSWVVQQPF